MTNTFTLYTPPTSGTRWGNLNKADVISAVASGGSRHLLLPRSLAIFRSQREGTDPALRGREGRRELQPVTGGER